MRCLCTFSTVRTTRSGRDTIYGMIYGPILLRVAVHTKEYRRERMECDILLYVRHTTYARHSSDKTSSTFPTSEISLRNSLASSILCRPSVWSRHASPNFVLSGPRWSCHRTFCAWPRFWPRLQLLAQRLGQPSTGKTRAVLDLMRPTHPPHSASWQRECGRRGASSREVLRN